MVSKRLLIPSLQKIQNEYGYLPENLLKVLSKEIKTTINDIYGVASFYTRFRFTKPAKHNIKVCLGTACHVRGGENILETFERDLGVKVGEKTSDEEFELQRVACVGCCALAPVVVVDEEVNSKTTPMKVKSIISKYKRSEK